jgi:16S rRNA (adenine1518-N6/adenine1519-N6)-dimethyltransferase
MINYNSAVSLRAFLDLEGIGMQKKFGQNFLINPHIRQTLVDSLGAVTGDDVWEIGPGIGSMTALLLEKSFNIKAFEIDLGFNRVLKKLFSSDKHFNLIEGDVLKTWYNQYKLTVNDPVSMNTPFLLGNLPYNIAATLLANFIEKGCNFKKMVITVQKEVALRMIASAHTPEYSSFSVLCASAYKVKPLMTIGSSSFFPQPNVDSMGVLLENHLINTKVNYPLIFYPLVRALFSSRRKTIKNNLISFLLTRFGKTMPNGMNTRDFCTFVLMENTLNENLRAENLELDNFISLARTIENMRK